MSLPRRLVIFARRELTSAAPTGPALLLEGDWPAGERAGERWSLDAEIDARDAWIDCEAARLAEQAAGEPSARPLANVFSLKLRYYFVRLLRVVAFVERHRDRFEGALLVCESPRDDDYVQLLEQLLPKGLRVERLTGLPLQLATTRTALWRRAVGWGSRFCQPRRRAQRVLLCGNPRHLEAVADAFHAAGLQPWWLYDTPALSAILKRRPRGEGQLACDASAVGMSGELSRDLPELLSRDVDVSPVVSAWLEKEAAARRDWLARVPSAVERHLNWLRPQCLVLDQDATPLARLAVSAARVRDIPSLVVQHGAPCVRFGFVLLAADRFCAWGEPTRQTLIEWGVDPRRVVVTGCPRIEQVALTLPSYESRATHRPRLLLLATVPPRDGRPDSVEFHLTTRTYSEMLSAVGEIVERLGAELLIRPHPRGGVCHGLQRLLTQGARLAPHEPLEQQLASADCVLSCASSAGLEAAHLGAAVVNLMPAGSSDRFDDPRWGLVGTARDREELFALVEQCVQRVVRPARSTAFDSKASRSAAQRVVALAQELIEELAARRLSIPSPETCNRTFAAAQAVEARS